MENRDLWCGKTFPEHSAQTKEQISEQSSQKRSGSQNRKPPLFLSLKMVGQQQDASQDMAWEENGALRGEYLMRSFGESPKDGVESHLSQILEACPHPKYYLSAKACTGILSRADRRGKPLPPPVKDSSTTAGECDIAYCIQGNCIDRADTAGCNGRGWTEDVSYTLNTVDRPAVFKVLENHPQDCRVKIVQDDIVQTLSGKMGTGGGNTPMVFAIDRAAYNQGINAKYDIGIDENGPAFTVLAKGPGAVCIGNGQVDQLRMSDTVGSLDCMHDQKAIIEYPIGVVRRLTPLECERLQGFPDGWTDIGDWIDSKGKTHKCTDSARYKALGNSISLPNWYYVLQRLSVACGADVSMASLFDGIGGFPLLWETFNGSGSCVWGSEIEEFPIAVTKLRFPEKE